MTIDRRAQTREDLSYVRKNAMDMNRVLHRMPVLIYQTKRLAINAEIASSNLGVAGDSFVTVVQELRTMGDELQAMVEVLEGIFQSDSRHIAKWIQSEQRFRLMHKALAVVCEEGDGMQRLLDEGDACAWFLHDEDWDALSRSSKSRAILATLVSAMKLDRDHVNEGFAILDGNIGRLNQLISRVLQVAVRKSHFIATAARIESSKLLSLTGKLTAVSDEIAVLSSQLRDVAAGAEEQIQTLHRRLKDIQRLRKRELIHAESRTV